VRDGVDARRVAWPPQFPLRPFAAPLKLPPQHRVAEPPDFRSAAFRDAAHELVQSTGCALVLCRQELFMAEGNAEDAYLALMTYKFSGAYVPLLH
jgi:hypothetical protein